MAVFFENTGTVSAKAKVKAGAKVKAEVKAGAMEKQR